MLRTLDLALRVLYVLLVPALLAAVAQLMPVWGLVATTALATLVAMGNARRWRASVEGVPLAGKKLGDLARLGEYYAAHPPRPLIAYLLYPLLLFSAEARRELKLYRGFSAVALVLGLVEGAVSYVRLWAPEIDVPHYLGAALATLAVQLILVFTLVMPLVTTAILLHQRRRDRTLGAVVLVGLALGAVAFVGLSRKHFLGLETESRIRLRSELAADRAKRVMTDALEVAIAGGDDEQVRTALEALYRPDEAHGFTLAHDGDTYAIFVRPGRRKPLVWRAMTTAHAAIDDAAKLPPALRDRLGL